MFKIRYVLADDKIFWFKFDTLLSGREFELKIRDKRGYIITYADEFIGIMRYNLLWDQIPFLTLIYLDESKRRKGFGRQAMQYWENEMREFGYDVVMTSTRIDEDAQHFYRKLGYKENGGILFDNMPFEQPQEIFMFKVINIFWHT